jgi:hypothetical protein
MSPFFAFTKQAFAKEVTLRSTFSLVATNWMIFNLWELLLLGFGYMECILAAVAFQQTFIALHSPHTIFLMSISHHHPSLSLCHPMSQTTGVLARSS